MTQSTCCKATDKMTECICNDYDGKGVSACGVPCPIHTPPPVPSEIDGEIREIVEKILGKHTLNYTKTGDKDFNPPEIISFDTVVLNKYEAQEEMIKAITALLTHHTSEKVKEEHEKCKQVFLDWCWDKEGGATIFEVKYKKLSAQAAEGEGEI